VNVTLGIPRLREIIMTASKQIKTPLMELQLLNPLDKAGMERNYELLLQKELY
jgi:DNA-directed RNA polymerase I subunit RPA1